MVTVLSASAGSGKTFNIASFYISKAIQSEQSFEKILALTFTNAAVSEMKNRIIQKLHVLSLGDAKAIDELIEYEKTENNLTLTPQQIQEKAKKALHQLLHNYQKFSIYTIDSFFQRILRSSLYEIGIFNSNDLVVDNSEIISDTIERFLFSLEEENEIIEWLKQFYLYLLSLGSSVDLKKALNELSKEINKEFFFEHEQDFSDFQLDRLTKELNRLQHIQKDFIDEVCKIQQQFDYLCVETGLAYDDFLNGAKGLGNLLGRKFGKFTYGDKLDDIYTKTLINFINSKDWFSKSAKAELISKFRLREQSFKKLADNIENLFK